MPSPFLTRIPASADLKGLIKRVMVTNVVLAAFTAVVVVVAAFVVSGDAGKMQSHGVPIAAIIIGMLSFFVATIGYEGARFNRREASVVCIVLTGFVSLATLVFVIITFTADFSRDLSERWGLATPLVRRDIESSYDCCGFADIEDRPAYPCDTKARSCKEPLESSISFHMILLGVLLVVALVIEVVAFCLTLVLWFSQTAEAIQHDARRAKETAAAHAASASAETDTLLDAVDGEGGGGAVQL